jgi:glycosyltransferase involved in cell wall biosynthesis
VPKLSVTVITRNESADIDEALQSVSWADEIVVVDSESRDETVAIARRHTDRVVVREWPGYVDQKNYAASLATHDWILSLDADERVTPALADEIKTAMATTPTDAAFDIPRVTWHLGRWIRTTDWYPDYQLRLYHRGRASWPTRTVHESVSPTSGGRVGQLRGELQHYAYRDLGHHFDTMQRYTTLAAEDMRARGRRAGVFDLTIHPWAAFMRNYFLRRGFMDGTVGFVISVMNAYYVFLKFAKLWAAQSGRQDPPRPPAS